LPEAKRLALHLASKPVVALQYALDAVNRGLEMPFDEGSRFEASLFGLVTATEDMREGTRAFLEKRKPSFKGQ
jgi:enoyl-CoA hydratase